MTTDFSAVVRRHWKDTKGYLVAGREPCIHVAKEEIRHVRRRLTFVDLANIAQLEPHESWFMAVIVCKGDDLQPLAAWTRPREASRVHLYLHQDATPRQLAPWRDSGLPMDRVDLGVDSWKTLHKRLGWDLNVQVYNDHAPE